MKESTVYKYRLSNGGNPQDLQEGEGNYRQITLAIGVWLKSISLNGMIQIRIGRDLNGVKPAEPDAFEEMSRMLNEVLGPEDMEDDES